MSLLDIPDHFPPTVFPDGFTLKSLAEDNDHRKVRRLLWWGFKHGDEPPEDGVTDQEFKQSSPNYRKDLNIVVVEPGGGFVSYCGMWFEPEHETAYVEPVATDPDYRGLGLGKAAVLEGIRRCAELGARVAYVGSTLPIYQSIGFREIYRESRWARSWSSD